ncbi:hypothetical protein DFH08DRAFT_816919 [Mycena albidolilacea]|uniref:Uncharacterized protein n=1 Tax=Mycena albidolilacea TaxID=1033008 RepID=A0AAD6ZJB5_9AGAR|nr:hypothetical protein DFH08DRAFT_816919 [Mycena albidolilacea]
MPLMPELAVACREWQGKGAHYNVHQARRCKVHILMCTAGKSRAHYNGTTGSVEGLLHLLGMVRPVRRRVEVCLGEVVLDVLPRQYCIEFQKLVQGMARIGPEALWAEEGPEGVGQWVACAHCVARVEEIGRKGEWCVYCKTNENEKWREYCNDRWHYGWS